MVAMKILRAKKKTQENNDLVLFVLLELVLDDFFFQFPFNLFPSELKEYIYYTGSRLSLLNLAWARCTSC